MEPVNFLRTALLCLAGIALPVVGSTGDLPLGANVEGLLEYARANPEYAAMRYEADAAAQRVYPAGAFPDPLFRMELQNITNAGSDAAPSVNPSKVGSTKYTLVQPIPFWGKRDLKREVAEADAEQAQGRMATTWSELAASVKTAYARYYLVVHNEQLTREILDLLARLERIALVRYESGLVPQQDVIRAQVELTTMRGELLMQESEREGVRAALNSLLARKAAAPLARPERLRPVPAPAKLDEEALADRLRGRNPQLFADDARIRAAEKNRELTYKNRYPDFAVGVSPIQMGSRIGEWELMVEVNIPLQQESRRRQESEAEVDALGGARAQGSGGQSTDRRTVRERRRAEGRAENRNPDRRRACCRSPKPRSRQRSPATRTGRSTSRPCSMRSGRSASPSRIG